jgi:hypothetical protein
MLTGLHPWAELVPWRLNPALFAPTRGGSWEVASTGGPTLMTVIPVLFDLGVTVAMPPPSSAGREEEIVAL